MRKEAGEVVEAGPYGAFVTTAINKILLQTIQLFSPSVCLSVCHYLIIFGMNHTTVHRKF